MTQKESRRPTPPSEAPGESGDRAARREAEEALAPGTKDGEAGDAVRPGSDAQRRTAQQGEENGEDKKPSM
ncbi:hypothetical protein OG264_00655 [Streptomyces xanthophaeus]|uniref:hypothetical protein n=1 Tax=Streptomyces xanthophaeus TaxID=67385 RepID=UPI003866D072|nr:hypothetical protein OG264_00655 [Streptomyces xanthophaeus]WST64887.1 hypothetical protein OG605_37705 [Streptomyces xanthophaeus]